MSTSTIRFRLLAASAAAGALLGAALISGATASADAAPLSGTGFAADRPWWHEDHHDRWRDQRWDDAQRCVSVTGPFGHVTSTWCR